MHGPVPPQQPLPVLFSALPPPPPPNNHSIQPRDGSYLHSAIPTVMRLFRTLTTLLLSRFVQSRLFSCRLSFLPLLTRSPHASGALVVLVPFSFSTSFYTPYPSAPVCLPAIFTIPPSPMPYSPEPTKWSLPHLFFVLSDGYPEGHPLFISYMESDAFIPSVGNAVLRCIFSPFLHCASGQCGTLRSELLIPCN